MPQIYTFVPTNVRIESWDSYSFSPDKCVSTIGWASYSAGKIMDAPVCIKAWAMIRASSFLTWDVQCKKGPSKIHWTFNPTNKIISFFRGLQWVHFFPFWLKIVFPPCRDSRFWAWKAVFLHGSLIFICLSLHSFVSSVKIDG